MWKERLARVCESWPPLVLCVCTHVFVIIPTLGSVGGGGVLLVAWLRLAVAGDWSVGWLFYGPF